jgi:hypothetical protein
MMLNIYWIFKSTVVINLSDYKIRMKRKYNFDDDGDVFDDPVQYQTKYIKTVDVNAMSVESKKLALDAEIQEINEGIESFNQHLLRQQMRWKMKIESLELKKKQREEERIHLETSLSTTQSFSVLPEDTIRHILEYYELQLERFSYQFTEKEDGTLMLFGYFVNDNQRSIFSLFRVNILVAFLEIILLLLSM